MKVELRFTHSSNERIGIPHFKPQDPTNVQVSHKYGSHKPFCIPNYLHKRILPLQVQILTIPLFPHLPTPLNLLPPPSPNLLNLLIKPTPQPRTLPSRNTPIKQHLNLLQTHLPRLRPHQKHMNAHHHTKSAKNHISFPLNVFQSRRHKVC